MTGKEAIAMLKRMQEPEAWEPQINEAAFEALDMAIEALETQDRQAIIAGSYLLEGEDNVGDTIYRQAAIELAMQYCPDDDGTCSKADEDIRNLLDELENLPSAESEIIRCKDCYWHGTCRYEQYLGLEGYCSKVEER